MPSMSIWHGNDLEALLLQDILGRNCTCKPRFGPRTLCPGHDAMVHDQQFIDGLLWARRTRDIFLHEEWYEAASES